MRISKTTYSTLAAGFTPWVMVNYMQPTFNVAMAVIPSFNAASQSFQVQYTMDDFSVQDSVQLSQTTTNITVTDFNHGMSVGDSAALQATNGADGTWQVGSVTDQNNFVLTSTTSQTLSSRSGLLSKQRVFPFIGIPAASAARISANNLQPCSAVRLAVAALTAGYLDFLVIQGQD